MESRCDACRSTFDIATAPRVATGNLACTRDATSARCCPLVPRRPDPSSTMTPRRRHEDGSSRAAGLTRALPSRAIPTVRDMVTATRGRTSSFDVSASRRAGEAPRARATPVEHLAPDGAELARDERLEVEVARVDAPAQRVDEGREDAALGRGEPREEACDALERGAEGPVAEESRGGYLGGEGERQVVAAGVLDVLRALVVVALRARDAAAGLSKLSNTTCWSNIALSLSAVTASVRRARLAVALPPER